jgi:hypothetical protein
MWLTRPSDKAIAAINNQQKYFADYFTHGYVARKRKYIDDQEIEFEGPTSKFSLPDPTIITFALKPLLLLFNRHPFARTLHIQNRSSVVTYPFKLHIRNNEHFSAHPAFGTLKPSQHMPIVINFHPKHSTWRKEAEIIGSIQVRIGDEGWPGERYRISHIPLTVLSDISKTCLEGTRISWSPCTHSRS